jgi:hypothetical protein
MRMCVVVTPQPPSLGRHISERLSDQVRVRECHENAYRPCTPPLSHPHGNLLAHPVCVFVCVW